MKKIVICLLVVLPFTAVAQRITPEIEAKAAELVRRMTLREKLDCIGGVRGFHIRAVPRLGIPDIKMSDGPQGIRNDTKSTMFPCGIAAAATWDRNLVNAMGRGLGQDARARGVHILLGPGVNIYRSPLCGRNFEYFGEDPYLSGETAVQYVRGVQSEGVVATVKHFAGNNQEWDRHGVSSDIDERTLQEIYLPAFRKAVREGGAGAVMNSYNPLNGVHATENSHLNIDILRNQWGFDGILMSDWSSVYSTVGAANGGLDLEMPYGEFMNFEDLSRAVADGLVTERTVDTKVRHILQTLMAFGFFDRPQLDRSIPERNPFSDRVALDVARGSAVLLRNEGDILPLRGKRILVLGPNSGNVPTGGGSGFVHPFSTVSVLEGMTGCIGPHRLKILQDERNLVSCGEFFTAPGGAEKGLCGEYFAGKELAGEPLLVRTDGSLDFGWDEGAPAAGLPADGFSARWSGIYIPREDCVWSLKLSGDDGYRMFVDDSLVMDDWRNHSQTSRTAELPVRAGRKYRIRIEYYDNIGSASLSFSWQEVGTRRWREQVAAADAVVYCAGFDHSTERESHDRTFALPAGQDAMIERLLACNENLVVVLNGGGGIDMCGWGERVKGLLMAWYPGQEGGRAIAELLTGRISPSGKLPISIEKEWRDNPVFDNYYDTRPERFEYNHRLDSRRRVSYDEGVFVGYRGYDRSGTDPRYPFGFGLSYTTFAYSGLTVESRSDSVTVSFDMTNTGNTDGAEIAQVYVGAVDPCVPRPLRELKGYEKVFLRKGETKRIAIRLEPDSFAYYDMDRSAFVVDPGEYRIEVGASSRDIRLSGRVIR